MVEYFSSIPPEDLARLIAWKEKDVKQCQSTLAMMKKARKNQKTAAKKAKKVVEST